MTEMFYIIPQEIPNSFDRMLPWISVIFYKLYPFRNILDPSVKYDVLTANTNHLHIVSERSVCVCVCVLLKPPDHAIVYG